MKFLSPVIAQRAGKRDLAGVEVQIAVRLQTGGGAFQFRNFDAGIECERIRKSLTRNMRASGKACQHQVLCIDLQVRASALAIRAQSEISGQATGNFHAEKMLQVLKLRDGQDQLAMHLGLVGRQHDVAVHVHAAPIRPMNDRVQCPVGAAFHLNIKVQRRSVQRPLCDQRACGRARQSPHLHLRGQRSALRASYRQRGTETRFGGERRGRAFHRSGTLQRALERRRHSTEVRQCQIPASLDGSGTDAAVGGKRERAAGKFQIVDRQCGVLQ